VVTLKQQTISGLKWSFIENSVRFLSTFVVGIILARLLAPRDFGLVGMMMVFISVSNIFVSSGFGKALIRKQNCTNDDFSTVFYFNLVVSLLLYLIIFLTSESIGVFFNEPELSLMIKFLGLGILINGFTIIQSTRITKDLNFKLLTKIAIFSSVISGVVSIILAYNGYGAWSLIFKTLLEYLITSLLLWKWNKWIPTLVFKKTSFNELFSFGSKLLFVSLLDVIYRNIYTLVIGKFFSASDLGFYSRAESFKSLPSDNITSIVQNVSYPILSTLQNNSENLIEKFKTILTTTMFVSSVLVLGMASTSNAMVLTMIGEEWRESILYLQLLCFVGLMYPLHALNLTLLNVLGRSDLFLRLELLKKILAVPSVIIGVLYGIIPMILTLIVQSLIAYYINCHYTGKLLNYGVFMQIKDLLKPFLFAAGIALPVYLVGLFTSAPPIFVFFIQFIFGSVLFFMIGEVSKQKDYLYVKQIALEQLKKIKNG
jgi:O-antigen/teichoic acid export membrane protein